MIFEDSHGQNKSIFTTSMVKIKKYRKPGGETASLAPSADAHDDSHSLLLEYNVRDTQ